MANIKTVCLGTEISGTEEHEIEVFHTEDNEIFIGIDMCDDRTAHIVLDRPTAIKFSKILRTEISKINE